MNKPISPVVIIGCGDIGKQVAKSYIDKQIPVAALVHSTDSFKQCIQMGIDTVKMDLAKLESLPENLRGQQLYYFAPPSKSGAIDSHMQQFITAISEEEHTPHRLVYISTTGVYGDCQGRWIDENEPVKPLADRAKRRLSAEHQLIEWAKRFNVDLVILRVAGIYGPGKLPLERIRSGAPVIREEDSPFTNRIHRDDLTKIAIAAMEKSPAGEIYNISDGNPGTMANYFSLIATKAGLPQPPKIPLEGADSQLSAGMMSYMKESRRLSNQKMLSILDIELDYPDLESGINNSLN